MRFTQNLRSARTVINLCAASILLFAGVVMAKEFWETKTFDQWTLKECEKMLTDSPWTKELNLVSSAGFSASANDNRPPYVKYTCQLFSAPLVRQAIVRKLQISRKYDSLPDDDKRTFDNGTELILLGPEPDVVVVNVSFETNDRIKVRDLNRHWETQTTDLLRNSVFLRGGSKGGKVPIARYIPGAINSQEFQFVFPREIGGNEILKPGDKILQLEFEYPVFGGIGDGKGFVEFKTDKMKVNNEVMY